MEEGVNIFNNLATEKQKLIWYILNNLSEKIIFTFSEIEREMGYNNPMPQLRSFFKLLIEKGYFIESDKTKNGYPRFKFLKNNFVKDYEESTLFIANTDHIKKTRTIWDNI